MPFIKFHELIPTEIFGTSVLSHNKFTDGVYISYASFLLGIIYAWVFIGILNSSMHIGKV